MQSKGVSGGDSRRYVAFISYRHLPLDKRAAETIQRKIERYVIPRELRGEDGRKKLGPVFRDEDELPLSGSLSDSILRALDQSSYLIVICSPELPRSRWCEAEIRYFLKTHDRDHLLAVLVDGKPETSFSPLMLHSFDEDGNITGDAEPLAANIAGPDHKISKKALRRESVRILAALMKRSFDDLWQRERRRKTHLTITTLALALIVMSIFIASVLSLYFEAKSERSRALVAEQAALDAKAQTEQANRELTQSLVRSYVSQGSGYNTAGSYPEALAYYAQALTLQPECGDAKIGASSILQQQDWMLAVDSVQPRTDASALPPKDLYRFGALSQELKDFGAYVFVSGDSVRLWFSNTGHTYQMERATLISASATLFLDAHTEHLDREPLPAVAVMGKGERLLFFQAYGGYLSVYAWRGEEAQGIRNCALIAQVPIKTMYAQQPLLCECVLSGLWADTASHTLVIDDYGNAIVLDVGGLFSDPAGFPDLDKAGKQLRVKRLILMNEEDAIVFQIVHAAFKSDGSYALLKKLEDHFGETTVAVQYDAQGRKQFETGSDFYHEAFDLCYSLDESLLFIVRRGLVECVDSTSGRCVSSLMVEGCKKLTPLPDGNLRLIFEDGTAQTYTIARISAKDPLQSGNAHREENAPCFCVEKDDQAALLLKDAQGKLLDKLSGPWEFDGFLRWNDAGAVLWAYDEPVIYWIAIDADSQKFGRIDRVALSEALVGATYRIDLFDWGFALCASGPAVSVYNAKTQTTRTLRLQHQGYVPFAVSAREDGYMAAFLSDPDMFSFIAEIWNYHEGLHLATMKVGLNSINEQEMSYFPQSGIVVNDSDVPWPLLPEDPDPAAIEALAALGSYRLGSAQTLQIQTPSLCGEPGSWQRWFEVEYPYCPTLSK